MAFSKITPAPRIKGSPQQEIIWAAIKNEIDNIEVNARAGTGKSFSMVEGLKRVPTNQSSRFVAFNKSIADELKTKVPSNSGACTLHSLGNAALREQGYKPKLDQWKVHNLIENYFGRNFLSRPEIGAVAKLIGFCKNNLLDGTDSTALQEASFELGVDDRLTPERIAAVPALLEECRENTAIIDFDDMVWLPIALDLPIRKYDFLVVDESQDLNKVQQQLTLRAGNRIVVVGDPFQSIYAFRGADTNAMSNMKEALSPCKSFPLTVSRRCPQAAVELVKGLVPDFECLPDAIDGEVRQSSEQDMIGLVQGGDMILSRVNAPLLSLAYKLLKQDIPAKVQGRDIGEGLRAAINRIEPDATANVKVLLTKLQDWENQETSRILAAYRYNVESKLAVLQDRVDCIRCLTEGCTTVNDTLNRIKALFSDERQTSKGIVLLSSVHKAKGLEADNVWIARPECLPHPMAKTATDQQQERNLAYVAGTRFKKTITFMGVIPEVFQG
jgi:DNA helicase-2/ATP-dependent DNA helicase PcrA